MNSLGRVCGVSAVLLALSLAVCAQEGAGRVTLTGQVSPAISLSAARGASVAGGDAQTSVTSVDTKTITVSLSGNGEAEVDIPVQLRSNTAFTLTATFAPDDALAAQLSITRVEPTGNFVYPDAAQAVRIADAFDARSANVQPRPATLNLSQPLTLLNGSRISKAGTFNSPGNALEVVVRVKIQNLAGGNGWSTVLTISAAPQTTTTAR